MPEIVKTEVCDPCSLAGRDEGPLQRENWLTTLQEDVRLMQRPRLVKLLEHLPQAWNTSRRINLPSPLLEIISERPVDVTDSAFLAWRDDKPRISGKVTHCPCAVISHPPIIRRHVRLLCPSRFVPSAASLCNEL